MIIKFKERRRITRFIQDQVINIEMDPKIIVVTHKNYIMPKDAIYFPICVGEMKDDALKKGYQRDNTGENIAEKNHKYCELTAIYWAYKNLTASHIGIAHYRRHYSLKRDAKYIEDAISKRELEVLLNEYDIIVPKKKKYYITSLKSHYINSKKGYKEVHKHDIEILRNVILRVFPDYYNSFNKVMSCKSGHMLNMFIMKYGLFHCYCEWLFKILEEVEKETINRIDQNRYIGALSEFLLDVWLNHNNYNYKEVYLLELEKKNFIYKLVTYFLR